ncbi:hypothetical protein ABID70_001472 [Clavibacter michiganensis]
MRLEEHGRLAVRADVGAREVDALDGVGRTRGERGVVGVELGDVEGVVLLARVDDVRGPVVVDEEVHVARHALALGLVVGLPGRRLVEAVVLEVAERAGRRVGDGDARGGLGVLRVGLGGGAVGVDPHHPLAGGRVVDHLRALEDRGGARGSGGGHGAEVLVDGGARVGVEVAVEAGEVGVGVELVGRGHGAEGEALVGPGLEVVRGVDVHAGARGVAVGAVLAVPVVDRVAGLVDGRDDLTAVGLDHLPGRVEARLAGREGRVLDGRGGRRGRGGGSGRAGRGGCRGGRRGVRRQARQGQGGGEAGCDGERPDAPPPRRVRGLARGGRAAQGCGWLRDHRRSSSRCAMRIRTPRIVAEPPRIAFHASPVLGAMSHGIGHRARAADTARRPPGQGRSMRNSSQSAS